MPNAVNVLTVDLPGRGLPKDGAAAPAIHRASDESVFDELVRVGGLLTREFSVSGVVSVLLEQSVDVTASDLAAIYLYDGLDPKADRLRLVRRRGRVAVPNGLPSDAETVSFVAESDASVVVHDRDRAYFSDALLHQSMCSALVVPLSTPKARLGVLIVNCAEPFFYNRTRFHFLESFAGLASGMLHNSELFEQLRAQLRRVEALERYQENVFSSMTNLLLATDRRGALRYFNRVAAERLELDEACIGRPLRELFQSRLDGKILNVIERAEKSGEEVLGVEGILKRPKVPLDFSLNISPLRGKRGRHEGLILLFTDQTAERELKGQVSVVKEERRVIKDMFARYLSNELVDTIMQTPDLVRPGGDKKQATIFFADIRGYTSFSESKEPEYIIEVLNAYFSEAVEIIISHGGYIDKFIGDAIMAVWGVPLVSEAEDAVNAVSCAVALQQRVGARDRSFFRGEASSLKVGIGLHTGNLVAGNLGSARRMDYSVIGDTVNVAARLEGVARGGDVVITEATRDLIGDRFKVEQLAPVSVKGKAEPIRVFRVLKLLR